jgi:predicted RNase H-like nuclease
VPTVIGVDGCKAGWLAVVLNRGRLGPRLQIAPVWSDLPLESAGMVAVDMPVGLADSGPRACDIAARRCLPPGRKSSVFPPPRRYMLDCRDWAEANALGRAREGCGLSHQAWNITAKIRELDRALTPAAQTRVREAHPELIFHRLNGWQPVPSKKTKAGRAARLDLLAAAGLGGVETLLARLPRGAAQPDDLLDAAACALAARNMLDGTAHRVPESDPPVDSRGLRMEIWF